ncbi:MAG TPA: SDR family oxidoreductase [Solirubrobacterales bacterium]|nr:SDR family oxidoreductase [Solirubrobacterales bacterium]
MAENQRVALVSGANRGIGAEIARQLAADHRFVVFAGARRPDEVEKVDEIVPIELDVTDQRTIDAAQERIGADPGRLDVLVNNAGVYGDPIGAADYDLDRAHEVLEVNTFGPWRLIEAFLPLMRSSSQPRIVNVSSGAGQLSDMNGGRAAYRVSKAGLNALTRTLASDERWVKVNTMCPGWVRTDMGGSAAPRSVEEGADTAIWLATLPDDGPTGGYFRNRKPIPW